MSLESSSVNGAGVEERLADGEVGADSGLPYRIFD